MDEENHQHHSSSSSMLVPYDLRHRQLAVVPSSAAAASHPFSIPRGWGVEEVPRRDGSRSDMYYYEPGTGRKFRSIREVNRYLREREFPTRSARKLSLRSHSYVYKRKFRGTKALALPQNPKCRRMVVSGGKLVKLDDEPSNSEEEALEAPYLLPDGWIVEEVPRKHSTWADRYYYEPETGQKFRSLAAVERYLAELDDDNVPLSKALEEIKENKPLSKLFKLENNTKKSTPRNKNMFGEKKQASSFLGPPSKVTWVIAGSQGDVWNAVISEAVVPDAVKQQWKNRFLLLMND